MSGLVHVSAYTQSRHGNAVNVSSYDRSGLVGEGGQPAKKPWEGKTNQRFREKLSEDESSAGKPNDGYKERNTQGTGALGRYQLKNAALQDAGWKDAHGNWTEKARQHGVNSDSDFLGRQEAQEAALGDVMRGVERQLGGNGSTKHIGKTYVGPDGLPVTIMPGGLTAAGHRQGAGMTHRTLAKLERKSKGKPQKFTVDERRVIRRLRVFKDTPYTSGGW